MVTDGDAFGAGFVLHSTEVRGLFPDVNKAVAESRAFILTNFHVIESGDQSNVIFLPRKGFDLETAAVATATVLSTDPRKDLALLVTNEIPSHVTGARLGRLNSLISALMYKLWDTRLASIGVTQGNKPSSKITVGNTTNRTSMKPTSLST